MARRKSKTGSAMRGMLLGVNVEIDVKKVEASREEGIIEAVVEMNKEK